MHKKMKKSKICWFARSTSLWLFMVFIGAMGFVEIARFGCVDR
jgi:hypothetical protein